MCLDASGLARSDGAVLDEDPAVAEAARESFLADYAAFQASQTNPGAYDAVDKVAARSIMHLLPVRQDLAIVQSGEGTITDAIRAHFTQVHHRMLASQVCEDGFNRQKRCTKTGANNSSQLALASWSQQQ